MAHQGLLTISDIGVGKAQIVNRRSGFSPRFEAGEPVRAVASQSEKQNP
jgi:hypothetical protein